MFEFRHKYWFRQVELFFCFVIMIAVSAFLAFVKDGDLSMRIIGWVGLVFFGGGGLFAYYKQFVYGKQGRRNLMITEQGLLIANTVIPWSTIVGFRRWAGPGSVIIVQTNDCEKQIAEAGFYKRMLLQFNYKLMGAVFSFSDSELDGTLEDFIELCRPYMERK